MFDMFNIFGMETYEVTFEVYLEDKIIHNQKQQAPKEILMAQFAQLYQQIAQDKRPMKFKMIVPQTIWDKFEKQQKILNNEIVFNNNAMVSWEENTKESK